MSYDDQSGEKALQARLFLRQYVSVKSVSRIACSGEEGVGGERCAHVSGIYAQLVLAMFSSSPINYEIRTEQAESERGLICMRA
jgi:hypothetical protein